MADSRPVDPAIWRACAGTSVQIPTVDSRVYYFPQGHAEQSSSPPIFPPRVFSKPLILCRVISVRFLASPFTDEVFARIRLVPILTHDDFPSRRHLQDGDGDEVDNDDRVVVSFAKILTPSDANNGGGFSVPRFCADSIFPPLNFSADPPVQNILIRDVQGMTWEFRHIFRGTPRRHLLTTGWSKFVNSKKLIAGDSVVFMRNNRSGELFVGVRRAVRVNVNSGVRWNSHLGSGRLNQTDDEEEVIGNEGFSRNGRGKVSPEYVAEVADLAAQGMGFEIVYYPKVGSADFIVKAEVVEESLSVIWTAGMRVKMAMETEDSSRIAWFQGTVSFNLVPDIGVWQGSYWRMLQVAWDETEALRHVKRVSPWQVKYVVPTSSLHTEFFPPAKKFRVQQNPRLLPDGEGDFFFPMTSLSNSLMGQLNPPSFMSYKSFPAGMQGARQDTICVPGLSNLISQSANEMSTDHFVGNNITQEVNFVSTELNIGASSQSDTLSPDSQSSVHFFGTELSGKRKFNNTSVKEGFGSFQLFGKIIHMKEPVEGDFNDAGCMEDANCKEYEGNCDVNNTGSLFDLSLHSDVQQA